MKNRISQVHAYVVVGALSCLPWSVAMAEDTNAAPTQTAAPAVQASQPTQSTQAATISSSTGASANTTAPAADSTATRLPYGVEDVVKLSRAQISEDVILTYIQNSGTVYDLSAKEIVFLRNEGVSDHVINAMQDQKRRAAEVASSSSALVMQQPGYQDPNGTMAPVYTVEPSYFPSVAAYATAPYVPQNYVAPTYVAPTYEPDYSSSLYVIPYPSARAAYGYPPGPPLGGHYSYYGGSSYYRTPAPGRYRYYGGMSRSYYRGHH